jgi:tRNA G18 (ribose-2'-O)-methylase SpoU
VTTSSHQLIEITSADDPRLEDYRSLTDVALRRKVEPEYGLFIAEGEKVLRRAVAAGYEVRSVLVAAARVDLIQGLPGVHYVADYDVMEAVTGFHVHRGVLAALARPAPLSVAEVARDARRLMVLEELSSTTNLGAVFRSAAALGIDGIILAPTCGDPLYRRSVRVSMGQVFAIPYARCESWPGELIALRDAGWRVLALTPAEGALALDEVEAAPEDRLALLLGAEGPGLSDEALAAAGERVRIPMAGGVDSLNVAAAAAVAAYALRVREPDILKGAAE